MSFPKNEPFFRQTISFPKNELFFARQFPFPKSEPPFPKKNLMRLKSKGFVFVSVVPCGYVRIEHLSGILNKKI
jgi:hypothetical protein